MTVLLLSGSGPEFKNIRYFAGSLFDADHDNPFPHPADHRLDNLTLSTLHITRGSASPRPLLRPRKGKISFLITHVLESILYMNGEDFESFDLQHVWDEDIEPATSCPEAVLLSTTFICSQQTLRQAVGWIEQRFPGIPLILGGQYSNLKYAKIMRALPEVDYVIRGDGEEAIPRLLRYLRGHETHVPNLVTRMAGAASPARPLEYIDLDSYPAPAFPDHRPSVPYESMRGCPFSCRFCSYPAASPLWRYKSAAKIYDDWLRYAEVNQTQHIQALDSTFTVPKPRLRELFRLMTSSPVTWEAYSRANAIHDQQVVESLEAARCTKLSIGFESMSPRTLDYMHKQVRAPQNEVAHDLLRRSGISYRVSFMVGYPGERPDDYELTHDYIVNEFSGHFMLSVFSFTDETMPVWEDSQRFGLVIHDEENPDYSWSHSGMDVAMARALHRRTLDEARWGSEDAVVLLWQSMYELPLVPGSGRLASVRQEKLVERLAMLPVDFPTSEAERTVRAVRILDELERHGIEVLPESVPGTPVTAGAWGGTS